jgi:uncharacterized membrane protein
MLAFALAIGLLITGIFFVRNPERVFRTLSFGQVQNRFGVGFFRVVGWFYIGGGTLGVLMLIVAVVLNYSRSH